MSANVREALTSRQQSILDYIRGYTEDCGYPPTLREIGRHFGIRSTNGVNDHLRALEKKGHLERSGMKSRALRPIRAGVAASPSGFVQIPIVGRVAAGTPITATENIEDTISVDPQLLGRKTRGEVFGLRVQGESMIDAGIHDGDLLFVRKQSSASANDVVVAMIDDEATVKHYKPSGDTVSFVPANESMEPIVLRRRELSRAQILGIGIGVFRSL